MKLFATALCALIVAGCSKEPIATSPTDNSEITVEELFTHDGITVYRFRDAGRAVYITRPPLNVTSNYTQHCGKGCVSLETTTTLGAAK
ncbi:MAG: DUF4884 domain-containing protein [Alcaligenaceae bacterium]|nr:DUF4884 domain-containing protein [Alcaligenaceae bacterium SAGV5]MPS50406.1 DUF4884 domain-containing protein [Alcaligenaceae bacterium SAGV3]MPT57933.1 DUF4884 domain-containing protein [Alcaligenaceae bacterium]